MLVAGDQLRIDGAREDRLGLRRLARLAGFNFNDLDGREAKRPTRRGRTFCIVARQGRLGRGAQLADADQRDAQGFWRPS